MKLLEEIKQVKKLKKQIEELEEKYQTAAEHCASRTELNEFYDFNYKDFPRDLKIPFDTFEECFFQVEVYYPTIKSELADMKFNVNAWETVDGSKYEQIHPFVVTYDEFIKYFKEIPGEEK